MATGLAAFIEQAIGARGLTILEFEKRTGHRFRDVKYGKVLPPLGSLHRWAEVLDLSDDDRLTLLDLADQAHGGGTIAGWIAAEIRRQREDTKVLRRQVAEMQRQLDALEAQQGEPPRQPPRSYPVGPDQPP